MAASADFQVGSSAERFGGGRPLYVLMAITNAIVGFILMVFERASISESGLASPVCLFTEFAMCATSAGLALQ